LVAKIPAAEKARSALQEEPSKDTIINASPDHALMMDGQTMLDKLI